MNQKCKKCGEPLTPVQSGLPCPVCGSTDRIVTDGDQAVAMDRTAVEKNWPESISSWKQV